MKTTTRIALGVAGGAIAIAGPLGLVAAANAATTPTPTTTTTTTPWHGGGMGMQGGMAYGASDLAAYLADKLHVSADDVTSALAGYHVSNPMTAPGRAGTDADIAARHEDLAASLATALKVDAADVRAALDSYDTQRQADRTAALKETLDARVKAGTLTQAQADAILAAHDAGTPMMLGGGFGGFGGHGGRWS